MDKDEIKKIGIMAKTKANLDVDIIRLWTKYKNKIKKLDDNGKTEEADELEKEWKHIYKGFVQLFLPIDLSEEDYDKVMEYLWPEHKDET